MSLKNFVKDLADAASNPLVKELWNSALQELEDDSDTPSLQEDHTTSIKAVHRPTLPIWVQPLTCRSQSQDHQQSAFEIDSHNTSKRPRVPIHTENSLNLAWHDPDAGCALEDLY